MQIQEFLERSAQCHPHKVALVCGTRKWTYEDVEKAAKNLAAGFIELGIARWDRVAISLDNSAETVFSIFATLKIGAAFVGLTPRMNPDRLVRLLNDCGATALITDLAGLRMVETQVELPHDLKHVIIAGADLDPSYNLHKQCIYFNHIMQLYTNADAISTRPAIDMDPAALIYTSGSTGEPKAVTLTHLNILSATTTIAKYLTNTPEDIILSVLPLSHTYGLTQLLTSFCVGATLVLEEAFKSAPHVVALICRHKITGFALVPPIASALLDLNLKDYDCRCLRYITNAAAALPVSVSGRLREALPHVQLFSMYGLTECIRASFLPADQIDLRPASIGRGLANQEMYLVNEEGDIPNRGEIGELVVRGSNVMKGYWGLPEATAKVLRPGLFPGERMLHTGDLFREDEEGYFYFVGRKDDIINICGHKVSPAQIEQVLNSLDGVEEAGVVGVPDPILGHAIKAVITIKEGQSLTRREVIRHCATWLEEFMVPTVVEFRASLPKTPNGKIERYKMIGEDLVNN